MVMMFVKSVLRGDRWISILYIYTSVSVVLCFVSGWDIGIHLFSVRYKCSLACVQSTIALFFHQESNRNLYRTSSTHLCQGMVSMGTATITAIFESLKTDSMTL